MTDPDQTAIFSLRSGDQPLPSIWADNGFPGGEEQPAVDPDATFSSLSFIGAALRRSMWFWCAMAALGLVLGYGLYAKFPPAYQASTSVLVTDNPSVNPSVAIQTDTALAQSSTVAGQVVRQLGLPQSATSFAGTYTVAPVTGQVLLITVTAPSSSDAVTRATAVAAAFVQFHAAFARTQLQQQTTELDQQVSQAKQHLDSVSAQLTQLEAQPGTPQATLSSLRTQQKDAIAALAQLQYYTTGAVATARSNTSSIVNDTEVLDVAAPIPHSHLKTAARDALEGLVAGLFVGMGIVIVMALASDRLRRRDEVAEALGAPIGLSVGTLRAHRWLPQLPWRASARRHNAKRVLAHLRGAVPRSSQTPSALAVVAVDNARVMARTVVSFAVSYAGQGKQVVVADLSGGLHAARLLKAKDPGVRAVNHGGVRLVVAIPDRDDTAAAGPLPGRTQLAGSPPADETLSAACASADLLLTLTTLDPAFGWDHLGTWATDAVVVVTAGKSSATRIHGAGELIRLAGIRMAPAVLIGADKSDESLGATQTPDEPASVRPFYESQSKRLAVVTSSGQALA